MNSKSIKQAIEILAELGKKGSKPYLDHAGVCYNFERITKFPLKSLPDYDTIVRKWRDFSGNITYPVPYHKNDPHDIYWKRKNLWVGKYGEERRQFARYLAREYRKML